MSRMRKLVGHIGVDSGQMMLIDPCYVDSSWQRDKEYSPEGREGELSYNGACATTLSEPGYGALSNQFAALAFVTQTNYGDGVYPVYLEFEQSPLGGLRPAGMYIDFLPDEFYGEDDSEDEE